MKTNVSIFKKGIPVALGGILFTAALGLMSNSSVPESNSEKFAEADIKVDTVAKGLTMPWASALLPNGDLLVTERGGKLRLVKNGILDPHEITGIPEVWYKGQGGLLDINLHPDYKKKRVDLYQLFLS